MSPEESERSWLADLVRREGLVTRHDAPFRLSSGGTSPHYLDAKRVLSRGDVLRRVSRLALRHVPERFDAVGGLTMGADALAVGIACSAAELGLDVAWFSVRKEPKDHGIAGRWVVGADLGSRRRVLLVDDVVTTGASIVKALDALSEDAPEVEVVAALCVVDRGGGARSRLSARGLELRALLSHDDLAIPPVDGVAPTVA